jgi:deoxyribodipyrimidine photo-lyase
MTATLIWFRRDLRLTDHAALCHALSAGGPAHAVFVFDTDILDDLEARCDRRVEFILESVAHLKQDLEQVGGGLHVLHGSARRLIPQLARRLGVAQVHASRDYEPAARARDAAVAATLAEQGSELCLHKDQVIFEADEILSAAGTPFQVFSAYQRAWLARLSAEQLAAYDATAHYPRLAAAPDSALPSLADLGFTASNLAELKIVPGEAGAQALWQDFQSRIEAYKALRDFPARKGPSYLSVHLRFGTISVRQLARHALDAGHEGAQTWLSELIWREFYQMLLWHHPECVGHAFQRRFDGIAWPNPPGHFEAWCAARTGYPLVDAALRQLQQTGYMHNRLRMIVASFLVKDLHVDWRLGERYFAARLIDYDQAANIGGWQWSASVGTRRTALVPHLQPGDAVGEIRPGRPLHPPLPAGTHRGAGQVHPRPLAHA